MSQSHNNQKALDYHRRDPKGKLGTYVTKPATTQEDLSLAYSPGVAVPCLSIKDNPKDSFEYTWRGNTVAVISDGSAVLGLGDIGGLAGLPVMEGKALLFTRFAGIYGIPIVLDHVDTPGGAPDTQAIIETIRRIAPSFGGINLEDIKAPECFIVEDALQDLGIPVFHDDQHGTAIVVMAGLINSLRLVGKSFDSIRIVVNGAGAAGIRIVELLRDFAVPKQNIITCDSRGAIFSGRTENMNTYKQSIAVETKARTLADAIKGADVFIGVSVRDALSKEMVQSMKSDPIIFALANPHPEIDPDEAYAAGARIVSTGRSDYPNQINNVLGFPGIFRGALDVRARKISVTMKHAAIHAIAEIATEPFPSAVKDILVTAYPGDTALFDRDEPLSEQSIIPKALDPRVVPRVARYVAEAAIKEEIASVPFTDGSTYEGDLSHKISTS